MTWLLLLSIYLQASTDILGLKNYGTLRAQSERLTGMTDISFQEGLVAVPKTNLNPQGWKASIAFKAPAGYQPIFFLLPGATQDKTSYAALIRDLYERDPGVGILAIDLFGQGESLESALPLNRDIPVEFNGALVRFLHGKLRQNYENKIVLAGVSYGAGVALTAAFHGRRIINEMRSGRTRMSVLSFGEKAALVTNLVNFQGGVLKLMWPRPDVSINPFRNEFTRMSVFSQAAMAEPILLKKPFPWTLEANFRILSGLGEMDFDRLGAKLPSRSLDVILSFADSYLDLEALSRRYGEWDSLHSMMLVTDADHKINRAIPKFLSNWLIDLNYDSLSEKSSVFYGVPGVGEVYEARDCQLVMQYPTGRTMSTEEIWQSNVAAAYRSWFVNYDSFNPFLAWWQITSFYWWQMYNWAMNEWILIWTGNFNMADYTFAKMEDLRFIFDQWGQFQSDFLNQIGRENTQPIDQDGRFLCQPRP